MKILIVLMCLSISTVSCTINTATIDQSWIPREESGIFRVEGLRIIQAKPNSISLVKFSINLKEIQKVAGREVLKGINETEISESDAYISSSITDFKFKWTNGWTVHARVWFNLNIKGIKNSQAVVSRSIKVEDFKGSKGQVFWWDLTASACCWLWPVAVNKHGGEKTAMISQATLEAASKIYTEELGEIASIIFPDDVNNKDQELIESDEGVELEKKSIPFHVREEVWERDGGRCAMCRSKEGLEYVHIIPLSKGGSNTAGNIELLCEKCRSKGDKIE